jgi:NitT/TauT family transport system ATP-binding protein
MELTIEHLTKRYAEKAVVNGFSAQLDEGVYGLLGLNGSGKTTLMRMLVDILWPTDGCILLNGQDIHRMGDAYRTLVGYLPQEFGVYRNFTASRFLRYVSALKELNKKQAEQKIEELLRLVNLTDVERKKIRTFSGGMRQRVALIRTLAINPDLLLLDEPFSALDYQTRLAVSDEIYCIIKEEGKTAIMVTHDISEAVSLADRVIVLSKRPAKIKSIHDIKFSIRGRTPLKAREAPEFRDYFNSIWKELDVHVE